MTALANQLNIQEAIVNSGVQIFKLAAMANFIQGRRMDMVAACCLYSACRKEKPCRVMLIDFADKVQVCIQSYFLASFHSFHLSPSSHYAPFTLILLHTNFPQSSSALNYH